MKITIFLFLFSVLTVVPSYAVMTGNEWLAQCENKKSSFDRGFCMGYLNGLRDMEDWNKVTDRYTKFQGEYIQFPKSCMPIGVTLGQLMKIVKKWYNEHPEKLHERFDMQYVLILRETFPCKSR